MDGAPANDFPVALTHGGRYLQYNIFGNLFEITSKYRPPIMPIGRGAYGIVWYFIFSYSCSAIAAEIWINCRRSGDDSVIDSLLQFGDEFRNWGDGRHQENCQRLRQPHGREANATGDQAPQALGPWERKPPKPYHRGRLFLSFSSSSIFHKFGISSIQITAPISSISNYP